MDIGSKHRKVIDWLVCPKGVRAEAGLPETQKALLDEVGISQTTFYKWKKHPDFRKEWQERTDEVIGEPDKLQDLADRLYRRAMDDGNSRSNQDAALWYRIAKDTRSHVEETRDTNEMTTEEIEAEIRALMQTRSEQNVAAGAAPSTVRPLPLAK